jgi:2-keto-4-pentenoate hydratase/2-oxohepta-3-ene-1,7-dioic acid hydratase in catechol pathway
MLMSQAATAREVMPMQGARWMLVTYHEGDATKPQVGVMADGVVHRAQDRLSGRSMMELLAEWDVVAPTLRAFSPSDGAPVSGAHLLAPLRFPSKVLCVGANYYGHLAEMGIERPERAGQPFYFLKPPTTTIIGPGDAVVLPARAGRKIDWEAELAVVIGRRCHDVPAARARDVVAGWTVVNDISARDLLDRDDAVAPPFGFDWFGSKGEDTFCPMGPGIVPDWLVHDPQRLGVRLTVNGVIKQDSSTADMVCGIWDLIAAASRIVTLEPGDVIATGTPAGVGVPRGDFLAPGDEVVVEIEQVGTLRHAVVGSAPDMAAGDPIPAKKMSHQHH